MLVGDFLGAVLVDRVVVAGDQRVVVAEPDLLLAEVALALDALAVQARALHAEADVAQQRLHPRRRQHRVVDVVVGGGGQAGVALRPGLAVGVVEDHELELGGRDRDHAPLASRSSWARRMPRGAGATGVPSCQPRSAITSAVAGSHGMQAQRGEVRRHHHVAVAGLPARHRVPVDGVHVDVDGQQVVAALGAVRDDVVDEQPRRDPFAGQPALHVGEGDDDGVDVTLGDHLLQLGQLQHPGRSAPWSRALPLNADEHGSESTIGSGSPGIPSADLHNCHRQR